MTLLCEAKREDPAQAELRPTCTGPAMSKRQRVECASCVNLHLILAPVGERAQNQMSKLQCPKGLGLKGQESRAEGFPWVSQKSVPSPESEWAPKTGMYTRPIGSGFSAVLNGLFRACSARGKLTN
jgi:hypothetical protein